MSTSRKPNDVGIIIENIYKSYISKENTSHWQDFKIQLEEMLCSEYGVFFELYFPFKNSESPTWTQFKKIYDTSICPSQGETSYEEINDKNALTEINITYTIRDALTKINNDYVAELRLNNNDETKAKYDTDKAKTELEAAAQDIYVMLHATRIKEFLTKLEGHETSKKEKQPKPQFLKSTSTKDIKDLVKDKDQNKNNIKMKKRKSEYNKDRKNSVNLSNLKDEQNEKKKKRYSLALLSFHTEDKKDKKDKKSTKKKKSKEKIKKKPLFKKN